MNHLKRTLSVLLALAMLLSLTSIAATAANLEATSWAQMKLLFEQASTRDTIYIPNYVGEITAGPDDGRLIVSGNKSITLDLNGQTINRNLSAIDVDGHVIQVEAGSTLTIIDSSGDNSGLITGGWANNGGAVNNQGTLIIEGGTFAGNRAENGGAIRNYGTLTITGGVFKENVITGGGGAIWSNGTADISNALLADNTGAINGGAIANHGTMTLTDCDIDNNIASAAGGAIFTGNNANAGVTASLTLNSCTVSNNQARLGGGIYIDSDTATLYGTDLLSNTASEQGGGVYVNASSTPIGNLVAGGSTTFSWNTAAEGGGIYIAQYYYSTFFIDYTFNATATLADTDVANNTATADGGGIANHGDLSLNGNDSVYWNTCAGNGSGILNNGLLKMQGTVDVEGNDSTGAPLSNNVYLMSGKVITLTGALTGWIGVTAADPSAALTSGYSTYNANTDPEDVFFTNDGYVIRVDGAELRARLAQAVSYYDPISKTMKSRANCLVVDAATTLWENDWYAVTGSVTIGSRVNVRGNVNLILCNGAELNVPKGISVPQNANFTVWGQIEDYIVSDDYLLAGKLNTFSEDSNGNLTYPDRYFAGIGGDFDGEIGYDCGNITINGGRITAFGGNYGPGIGSTAVIASDQEAITINNGLIVAYGGPCDDNDSSGYSGAGIGGGLHSTSPRIIINGGGTYAQGSGGAAGIGGGYNGYYRPITITGGEVFAYGSPFAAGIGLGAFDPGFYTGSLSSDLGGGLIDIQGGKVVAVSMLRNDNTYIQQGGDPHNIDTGAGAFVYGERNQYLAFKGGVHLYDDAKVTYVRNFVSESEGGAPEVVFSSGNAYTEDDLIDRVWILMNSYKVTIEPCDHAGATYTTVSLSPQSGHVMHCTTCNLPEEAEPHTYDLSGRCTLCGYQTTAYTVSFNGNGASGNMDNVTVIENGQYALPVCGFTFPEGKAFAGWSVAISGETVILQPGESITVDGNKIVTAVWENASIFVAAHSLSLNGDIGVNFYTYIPNVTNAAYAKFTVDGKTVTATINLSKSIERDGLTLYKFSCSVAAAQIDTDITGVIYNGDAQSDAFTYKVQDYFNEAQTNPQTAGNPKMLALIGSLATYGYYANELFGFDSDFTQHALFDDSGFANVTAASLADDEAQIDDTADGVTYVGSSLVMRTETAIKHYFTLPAGKTLDDFSFLLGEGDTAVALTPKANGNFYYVEIPNIESGNLGKAYTVTVLDGDGSAVNTWNYSAMSYVYKVLTKAEANDPAVSAELLDAVRALALYYDAAKAYFDSIQPVVPDEITFYLTDSLGWGQARVYAWDADGNALTGDDPGLQAEAEVNDYGELQFIIRLPADAVGCYVGNGWGARTEDITDFSHDVYWMVGTQDNRGHYLVTAWD